MAENENDNQLQLVTFLLGEEKYGVDIMDVKEIVRTREIRPIPNCPPYVAGILNLRGIIIPIIDLHRRFQLRSAAQDDEEALLSGIMVIDIDGMELGIFIDRILRVVAIEAKELQSPPQMISGIGAEYIQSVVSEDNGYLLILNIRRIFDTRELAALGTLGRQAR